MANVLRNVLHNVLHIYALYLRIALLLVNITHDII